MNAKSLKTKSKTDWNRIDAMSDDDIDCSDIPELSEDWFKNAQIRTPSPMTANSINFDSDILEWFKSHGKKHQQQINAILRDYIKAHA
ncbi:MAG: BrnA antitoxin family protein [Desulfamplus sp.]|nr:BrnA antitoxin family protein [Desulfamplus sp.]